MYDPFLAKSFSRIERRRLGCGALVLCFIFALGISSTFKPRLRPLSFIGEAVNLQLSINAVEDLLIFDESKEHHEQIEPTDHGNADGNLQFMSLGAPKNTLIINKTNKISQPADHGNADGYPELSIIDAPENGLLLNKTNGISEPIENEKLTAGPLCRTLESDVDYCEIEGDIRIHANSSTIFVVTPQPTSNSTTDSWNIEPYTRKGIPSVKHWTVKSVGTSSNDDKIPKCDQSHTDPAILFSVAGYSGNHFHAFADVIFPLYSSSIHFQKQVYFLATDYKPWWIEKYKLIFDKLSQHQVIDIGNERARAHCYTKMIVGLKFHKEFIVHPSLVAPKSPPHSLMQNFRQILRDTYALQRKRAVRTRRGSDRRPRLMIVSRRRTRILTNEHEVSRIATKLGFEVVSAEAQLWTNMEKFAQIVNSCDVMMGIHGAGLTNMLFLPDNAVLIQVVPLGGLEVFARLDFGNPAAEMNIRYLEYKITANESSLSQQYSMDDPVIKDPISVRRKGWNAIKSVYLENQNVTIDVRRFKGTLARALKLLRR